MSNIVQLSERTKWYDAAGQPCEMVMSADGTKRIKADIRHARRDKLFPSVTCILSVLDEPYLEQWKIEQALLMSFSNPRGQDESDAAYVTRVCGLAKDVVEVKAERGKVIHGEIEEALRGRQEPRDPAAQRALKAIQLRIAYYCSMYGAMTVVPEGTFANAELYYAGRYDIKLTNANMRVYMDVKTTDLKKFAKPFPKWGFQGGGYLLGDSAPPDSIFEQVVVDRDTGESQFLPWNDTNTSGRTIEELKRGFLAIRDVWGLVNKYEPWRKAA